MGDRLGISGAVGFLPFLMFPILSFLPPSDVLSLLYRWFPSLVTVVHTLSLCPKGIFQKGMWPKGASPASQGTGEWLFKPPPSRGVDHRDLEAKYQECFLANTPCVKIWVRVMPRSVSRIDESTLTRPSDFTLSSHNLSQMYGKVTVSEGALMTAIRNGHLKLITLTERSL